MDVAASGLDHEEAVPALNGHRAVPVKEAGGEHRRGLRMQELPPRRVGVPCRRRRIPRGVEDLADRGGADPVAELEHLALDPLIPQQRFSAARRSISTAISGLTGGRPVRFG
jgi:hypothetical protein